MARRSRKRGWQTIDADPAQIGPLLREAGFVGCDADPSSVRGSFDGEGRPRRIHARYPDGWTCCLHMSIDGSYSLTQSIRMRVTGRRAPA